MNEFLHDRIMRKLSTLSDERLYQVLDYVDFLESRYAERPAPSTNVFQRFAETVEDRLRSGRVSAQTISETMGLMNRAMSALNGVAAAGASVAKDVKDVYDAAVTTPPRAPGAASGTAGAPSGKPAPVRESGGGGAEGTSGGAQSGGGTNPDQPSGIPPTAPPGTSGSSPGTPGTPPAGSGTPPTPR